MNQILYEKRCKCKEDLKIFTCKECKDDCLVPKKRKTNNRSEEKSLQRSQGKPLQYPNSNEITSKTFQIKYEKKLSSIAKLLLNSFQKKYFYYAIDDILYLLKSNSVECNNLLAILYAPIISLQNNLSINFFDIWIHEISINETPKVNKFLTHTSKNFEPFSYITIKLLYKIKVPIKKQESLW